MFNRRIIQLYGRIAADLQSLVVLGFAADGVIAAGEIPGNVFKLWLRLAIRCDRQRMGKITGVLNRNGMVNGKGQRRRGILHTGTLYLDCPL